MEKSSPEGMQKSTSALLRDQIIEEKKGKSIFINNTRRISAVGKRSAAAVFSLVMEQGRSPEDIRRSIAQVRVEAKASLAEHKRELKKLIESDLLQLGFKKKGNVKEFRSIVAQQLASELAVSATVRSTLEIRKLLTSINQRARLAMINGTAVNVNTGEVSGEAVTPVVPASTEGGGYSAAEEHANARADALQGKLDSCRAVVEQQTQRRLRSIGWSGFAHRLGRPLVAALLFAGFMTLAVSTSTGAVSENQVSKSPSAEIVGVNPSQPALVKTETTVHPTSTPSPAYLSNPDLALATSQPIAEAIAEVTTPSESVNQESVVTLKQQEEAADLLKATNEKIKQIVETYKKKNIDVRVSIADIASGEQVLGINEERVDMAASTGKLYTAAAVFDEVNKGRASLDELINEITIRDLLKAMINQSDNNAWDILRGRVGGKKIQQFARTHGATQFEYSGNTTTPKDLAMFLSDIYKGDALSENQKELFFSWMRGTNREDLLTSAFNESIDELRHKYGLYGTVVADAGIVKIGGRLFSVAVIAGGKSFMDPSYQITDGMGLTNRVRAIQTIGPAIKVFLVDVGRVRMAQQGELDTKA